MTDTQQPRLDHNSAAFIAAETAETALQKTYHLTAHSHFFEDQSGLRIRLTEIGEGKPVFLVPGNTGDLYPYIPMIATLPGYHFYILNRPGGGLSDGFDHTKVAMQSFVSNLIDRVWNHLGLTQAPIVAHSMGCHWAAWFIFDHPEKVTSFVMIGNPGRIMMPDTPKALSLMLHKPFTGLLKRKLVPKDRSHAKDEQVTMGTREEVRDHLPETYYDAVYAFEKLPNYAESTITLLQSFQQHASLIINQHQLKQLKLPTALIWGEKDPLGPLDHGREIAESIDGCQFDIIKDSGHMPWMEEPEQVSSAIKEFI